MKLPTHGHQSPKSSKATNKSATKHKELECNRNKHRQLQKKWGHYMEDYI